ncbi:MAG: GNAT family N-acetyltransferase [Deltaproteobacteria bacterium]|nr:GNAT family N-acetyltransferase [Deltaproteobacteria bacterium]
MTSTIRTDLRWTCKAYHDLSLDELYAVLKLRQQVFCVEQRCAYLDCDGHDRAAWHVFATAPEAPTEVLATARFLGPGVKYAESSIGRVCCARAMRRTGIGKALMAETLEALERTLGPVAVRISAQSYLQSFYRSFGFVVRSPPYIEDDIEHVEMLRPSRSETPPG